MHRPIASARNQTNSRKINKPSGNDQTNSAGGSRFNHRACIPNLVPPAPRTYLACRNRRAGTSGRAVFGDLARPTRHKTRPNRPSEYANERINVQLANDRISACECIGAGLPECTSRCSGPERGCRESLGCRHCRRRASSALDGLRHHSSMTGDDAGHTVHPFRRQLPAASDAEAFAGPSRAAPASAGRCCSAQLPHRHTLTPCPSARCNT